MEREQVQTRGTAPYANESSPNNMADTMAFGFAQSMQQMISMSMNKSTKEISDDIEKKIMPNIEDKIRASIQEKEDRQNDNVWITGPQVCNRLHITKCTLYRYVKQGLIKKRVISRKCVRYKAKDIDDFMERL